MTVAQVRAELVAKLETITAIAGRVHSSAPDSFQPPSAFVGTMQLNPRAALLGVADVAVEVWVGVSRAGSTDRAVDALDAYVDGASSIPDALESASSVWDDLSVTSVQFPVTFQVGAGEYVGAQFSCDVFI